MTVITGNEIATNRIPPGRIRGPSKRTACDRCPAHVRLMCHDRAASGRAVLCEILTPEQRELEYAIAGKTR